MSLDLILRAARLPGAAATDPLVDIGVRSGRIAALAPRLEAVAAEEVQAGGRLVCAGFVETHIHLDKSCILGRCACEATRFPHLAMERVSAIKPDITVEDVSARAAGTLEKCVLHGCTRMRTHVEVDPRIGLRGFEGVKALIDSYAWAIDVEICVMPQEGLTNNPGTDELMVAALRNGARVVGAAPNYDSDRAAQIRRVFEMAREFDVDIDMHLDSGASGADLDTLLVCELTEKHGWGGRVAIGHVTKLSTLPPAEVDAVARRMADAGVALTVLPATDLYLGGRHRDADVPRSVVDANRLAGAGVACSLSSNNILNPFTPFGDGQLIRQANLYANIVQRGTDEDLRAVWSMITDGSARILRQGDYGLAVGGPADLVLVDAADEVEALRGITPVLAAFKRGRRTVTRAAAVLHRPG
jgi:cytosine deaminase